MFQTISNIQRGDAVSLQQYIDNRGGDLRVGLRSITYTVGWFMVREGESISKVLVHEKTMQKVKRWGSTDLAEICCVLGSQVALKLCKILGQSDLVKWENSQICPFPVKKGRF